ncbi:MAG TPA: sugar phosphate isomerase/epimerase family protein [Chryseolinea sp.]|nr:sugar phosphate isomerase/epimerase family protein [Chryseolinea sp.]
MQNTILLCLLCVAVTSLQAQKKINSPEIGVVQNIENDSLLHAFGYRCLVESTARILSPINVSDSQFKAHLQTIKKSHVPLLACNLFIPANLKVVGPSIDESAILKYVEIVFQRAQTAGLKMIVWGSGGSRGVPEGFDHARAMEQFISIAREIVMMAAKYDIVLALESLDHTECNFITTTKEALEVVKVINHKNLRLCVDIYHMLKEGESPDIISETKKYLVYCEIAEKEGRTPPGVHGDDFRPYFTELKKVGYKGKIVLECRWGDVASQGAMAYEELRKQIDDVYKN